MDLPLRERERIPRATRRRSAPGRRQPFRSARRMRRRGGGRTRGVDRRCWRRSARRGRGGGGRPPLGRYASSGRGSRRSGGDPERRRRWRRLGAISAHRGPRRAGRGDRLRSVGSRHRRGRAPRRARRCRRGSQHSRDESGRRSCEPHVGLGDRAGDRRDVVHRGRRGRAGMPSSTPPFRSSGCAPRRSTTSDAFSCSGRPIPGSSARSSPSSSWWPVSGMLIGAGLALAPGRAPGSGVRPDRGRRRLLGILVLTVRPALAGGGRRGRPGRGDEPPPRRCPCSPRSRRSRSRPSPGRGSTSRSTMASPSFARVTSETVSTPWSTGSSRSPRAASTYGRHGGAASSARSRCSPTCRGRRSSSLAARDSCSRSTVCRSCVR